MKLCHWLTPAKHTTWRDHYRYIVWDVLWRHLLHGHECYTCSERNLGSHLTRIHRCDCGKDMTGHG